MRVLLLCDRFPYPLTNGQNLRIYQFIRNLKEAHSFDLVCYGETAPPAELNELFDQMHVFPRPVAMRSGGFKRIVESWSPSAMLAVSTEVMGHVRTACRTDAYDVVWVSGWDMIQNLPEQLDTPVLADVVDDGVLEFWREFKTADRVGLAARKLKWVIVNYFFERKYFCSKANRMVVSETDAAVLDRVCGGRGVAVVHNGVDEQFYRPGEGEPESNTIVFEGNIAFGPNADGVRYFHRDVLPLVRKELPDVRFWIVGKDPPQDIRAMADGESVKVTGFVDDVRPYVQSASLFVCPLRKGAGIKNKLLQAWAMGKPVVATSKCIGGLKVREGQNILVRDDPQGIADAVVRLLRDPEYARTIGNHARETICESYTWSSTARQLERVLADTARSATIRN